MSTRFGTGGEEINYMKQWLAEALKIGVPVLVSSGVTWQFAKHYFKRDRKESAEAGKELRRKFVEDVQEMIKPLLLNAGLSEKKASSLSTTLATSVVSSVSFPGQDPLHYHGTPAFKVVSVLPSTMVRLKTVKPIAPGEDLPPTTGPVGGLDKK